MDVGEVVLLCVAAAVLAIVVQLGLRYVRPDLADRHGWVLKIIGTLGLIIPAVAIANDTNEPLWLWGLVALGVFVVGHQVTRGRRGAGGRTAGSSKKAQRQEALAPDPWSPAIKQISSEQPESLPVGHTGNGIEQSRPRTNVLVLGPPQCGKTSGILIPQLLSTAGPAIAVTTKGGDLFTATAQTRARLGRLWHFSPTNADDILPGTTQLRWSPISGCENWDIALRSGKAITEVAEVAGKTENQGFFRSKTAEFLSALFHAAALGGKSMLWVLEVVSGQERAMRECERILSDATGEGARIAMLLFGGFQRSEDRLKSNILATCTTAFQGYYLSSSLRTTESPNFSPEDFALSSDTIYIEAPTQDQEMVANLVIGLLSSIATARFALAADDLRYGRPPHATQTWILDELASMAPMERLPNLLSQSASQGVLISAALQDLSQAEKKWPVEGKGLLTLFGTVLVMPGIRNGETLREIADLAGREWTTRTSRTYTYGDGAGGGSTSTQDHQQAGLTPAHVHSAMLGDADSLTGNEQIDGRRLLLLRGVEITKAWGTPYYAASPYREWLVANAEHARDWPDLAVPRMSEAHMRPELAKRWKAIVNGNGTPS